MCERRLFKSFQIISLCLAVLLGSVGCRSLANPHVRPKPADRPNPDTDLCKALLYADKVQQRYNKAVGDQAKLTNWLGLTLIPLGAVGAFIGVTSSSRGSHDALLGLTMAGAATYGSGTWLSSKPRSLVYIMGAEAVGCAKAAVQPFVLAPQQERALETAIHGGGGERSLPDVLKDLPQQIMTVERDSLVLEDDDPSDPLSQFANDYAEEAKSFQAKASAGLSQAYLLEKRIAAAGQRLMIALDRIMAQVDKAIVATLPNLSALPGVIGGLRGQAQVFGEIKMNEPVEPAGTGEGVQGGSQAAKDLKKSLNVLTGTVALAEKKLAVIKSISDAIEQSRAATPLEECGVAIQAPSLKLAPSNRITVTSGEGFERRVVISGGQPLYFAELLDRVPGLTVESVSDAGAAFVLVKAESGKEIPAGTYQAIVYDTTGTARGQILEIVVKPAPQKEKDKDKGENPVTDKKLVELTPELTKEYQDALCVEQSGNIEDQATTEAVRILQRDVLGLAADEVDGKLWSTVAKQLDELGSCKDPKEQNSAANVYESYLVRGSRVRKIQQALGIGQPDGKFGESGSETREKIKAFQEQNQITPADGIMTRETFNKLLPEGQ